VVSSEVIGDVTGADEEDFEGVEAEDAVDMVNGKWGRPKPLLKWVPLFMQ